ncbi:MAG: hypothetical protein R3D00_31500 [Bacteroidia bacterium]
MSRLNAQEPDARQSRTYDRNSLTVVMANFPDLDKRAALNCEPISVPVKYDAHIIKDQIFPVNFSRNTYEIPQKESSETLNKIGAFRKLKKSVQDNPAKIDTQQVREQFNQWLMDNKVGNQIIAKWFDRTEDGVFIVDGTFRERALYNVNDMQVINSKGTVRGNTALMDDADKLVNLTYVLVLDIARMESMNNYYTRRETSASSRTKVGYRADVRVHLFKLDFGDSVQSIFWNDLWVESNDDSKLIASRKEAFDNMSFPFRYERSYEFSAEGVQDKNPPQKTGGVINAIARASFSAKSDDELFASCMNNVMNKILSGLEGKGSNENFGIAGNILKTDPISVKLGTKEGIKVDNRFFVMEDRQNAKGELYSKRVGVVRVYEIGDNAKVADGNILSGTSVFYQIQGKKPYEGMFLRENNGFGANVSIGMERGLIGGMSGFSVRGEFNLSQGISSGKPGHSIHGLWLYGSVVFDMNSKTRKDIENTTPILIQTIYPGPNETDFIRWSGGFMLERYFARNFHYSGMVGYAQENTSNLAGALYNLYLQQHMAEAGGRLGFSLHPNMQIEAGVVARMAISKPRINGEDVDKAIKLSSSYGDIFTGRGIGISTFVGMKITL